jgi:hypothetical protein
MSSQLGSCRNCGHGYPDEPRLSTIYVNTRHSTGEVLGVVRLMVAPTISTQAKRELRANRLTFGTVVVPFDWIVRFVWARPASRVVIAIIGSTSARCYGVSFHFLLLTSRASETPNTIAGAVYQRYCTRAPVRSHPHRHSERFVLNPRHTQTLTAAKPRQSP